MTWGRAARFLVGLVLLAAAALIGWLMFLRRSGNSAVFTGISVQVIPHGSEVYINDEFRGRSPIEIELASGEYHIRVQHDHRLPWESTGSLLLGERLVIERSLVFQPYSIAIARPTTGVFWDISGGLNYISLHDFRLRRYTSEGTEELAWVPGSYDESFVSPDGAKLLVLANTGFLTDLFLIGLADESFVPIAKGAQAPFWAPEGGTIYYFGWGEGGETGEGVRYQLWMSDLAGSVESIPLVGWEEALIPERSVLSLDGEWLITEAGEKVVVWRYEQERLVFVSAFEALEAAWSPAGVVRLFYFSARGAPMIYDVAADDHKLLSPEIRPPAAWSPDGGRIVYAVFRPEYGGTAVWSVDTETGARFLLADPGLLPGEVESFVISPDGRRIAFQNPFDALSVLFVSP